MHQPSNSAHANNIKYYVSVVNVCAWIDGIGVQLCSSFVLGCCLLLTI